MKIVVRGSDHLRAELEAQTFDCGAHEYHVRFESPRTIKLWISAPGVTAVAYMRVLEGATKDASLVVYSLIIDARERMVVRYLADLERAFRAREGSA